ncbi:MAG TPA: ice-binding family protein [Kofleriaceae bacterium]
MTATGPLNAAANVSVNKRVSATFSRMMAPATLNSGSFTVQRGPTAIAGVVSYAGTTATFVPNLPLGLSLQYTATITTGAADTLGRSLASNFVWSFTTGACSQAAVALGAAGNMAVLAGSTVTSTGPTAITGDLGLSPGTATSVTGFPPGNLMGVQHAGDSAAAVALGDLTTAYNDAAGRTLCAMTVAGNLGGQTLTPGLYKSTSSLAISSGDLTLDAQGDPDAVFIFQMASTLTTTSGRKVILSGGARAANVFWQVGSSATLGTTSVFQGTIMADQAITMATGATLNGRALARVDGVFLDSNTIVKTAL